MEVSRFQHKMKKSIICVMIVLAVIMISTGACAKTNVVNKKAVVSKVKEIKITASSFRFEPDVIKVKKGEKIRIIAKSIDVTHGIKIEGYNINQELPPDKEKIIEFTADKTGEFEIACSVYCGSGHRDMKAKLIVLP